MAEASISRRNASKAGTRRVQQQSQNVPQSEEQLERPRRENYEWTKMPAALLCALRRHAPYRPVLAAFRYARPIEYSLQRADAPNAGHAHILCRRLLRR